MQCTNNGMKGYKMTDTQKNEIKLKYFVSYWFVDKNSGEEGFGNLEIYISNKIMGMNIIRYVEDYSNKKYPNQKTIVLNFQKLPD